jgi:hypothetical protein
VVVLYGLARFGLSPEGAKSRYSGDEEEAVAAPANQPASAAAPKDPFDDEGDGSVKLNDVPPPAPKKQSMYFEVSWDELLRLTHVHTFAGGMLFYILGHLFSLTTVRPRLKRTLLLAFFASIAFFIGGPFLIRYVTAKAAYLFLVAIFTFIGCGLFFAAAALWDMWGPRSREPIGSASAKELKDRP